MESFSLAGIVQDWAARAPDRPALTLGADTLTWRDLKRRSDAVAGALTAEGVRRGDRVAFLDKNSTEFFEVLFGSAALGAVTVAVNWRLAPTEIAFVLNDALTTVLVLSSDYLATYKELEHELTTHPKVVVIGPETAGHTPYEDWLAAAAPVTEPVPVAGSDTALQLYTSGTTGTPKGVLLPHRCFESLVVAAARYGMDSESVSLAAMPMVHIGGSGWALLGMALGAHTVLLRELEAPALMRLIPRARVTHAFLVPTALRAMTMVPGVDEFDLSSLQTIAYGASPVSPDLLLDCQHLLGCDLVQLYGLTETTGAVTLLDASDHLSHDLLLSAGRPMEGVELRIVDRDTLQELPDGEIGEVWIRSRQVMAGYWHDDSTAEVLHDDGWFRSGDAGYLKDGYLFLHDRIKDLVITGGENVYPAEVENVLLAHPCIVDAAVFGVPSEQWGEELRAVVVVLPRARYDLDEVLRWCRNRLAGYKVPKSVTVVAELPRSASGKVLKRVLRDPYWAGRQRPIA